VSALPFPSQQNHHNIGLDGARKEKNIPLESWQKPSTGQSTVHGLFYGP